MNMINQTFDNLPQRSIYYFLATYPPFIPIETSVVTDAEQKNAYDFIKSIYERLYADPSLLGFKIIPDDALGDWELQKSKPGLVPKIRNVINKTEELINVIFTIALSGDNGQIKPSMLKKLANFNIPENTLNGLALLAKISDENSPQRKPYLLFSRGVFDVTAPYTQEVFGDMLPDRTAFDTLISYLKDNDFIRVDNKPINNQISLDYIKNYGDPNAELKSAWAERTHSGIEVTYDETKKYQPLFSMRVPHFNTLLKQSDKMNDTVKKFVTQTSKKCDACRYCVMTDKTGKRPLMFIPVDEYNICPFFCGFRYRWKTLNGETVTNIIEMLEFIAEVL